MDQWLKPNSIGGFDGAAEEPVGKAALSDIPSPGRDRDSE